LRYCLRCCYPVNTKPYIIFDDKGICSGCRVHEQGYFKDNIDWASREKELRAILESYKKKAEQAGSPYDCIIPVSGGKDSHYQAHLITKVYKMRPLFVTYNHAYNSKIGIANLTNLIDKFGCDLLRYTTNPKTAAKISRYFLKKIGDITWHYHAGIMTFPIQVAVRYKIPLIIWGEQGESYLFGMFNLDDKVEFTKKTRQEQMMRGFEPEDVLDDPENKEITKTDLAPFFYPSDDEISSIGVRGIYLGNYHKWDQQRNVEFVIKNYEFKTLQSRQSTFNLYEKTDDFFQDTHNYLKYLKFGYSRCTDHASVEIRAGRMTREQGIEMIRKYEYLLRPKNLDVFLKFIGYTEKQFVDEIEHLRDPNIWQKKSDGKWELLDWIGNHIDDDGVESARLPLREKWEQVKSTPATLTRNVFTDKDDEECIYL